MKAGTVQSGSNRKKTKPSVSLQFRAVSNATFICFSFRWKIEGGVHPCKPAVAQGICTAPAKIHDFRPPSVAWNLKTAPQFASISFHFHAVAKTTDYMKG